MSNQSFFTEKGWRVVDVLHTDARPATVETVDDLTLSPLARTYLHTRHPEGIYRHQKAALQLALSGKPVCLSTGTASGKSLVFQLTALDLLARNPKARVMAIYPMKALSNEQRDRWEKAVEAAGVDATVGRIDGNVPPGIRLNVLERSRVVVFTPDILHAWLFSNMNAPAVQQFLANTALVVVDEVHAYNGVFGSNAAFLFRRLQHVLGLLGSRPVWIGASATVAQPQEHLASLFGLHFELIGAEMDTSPRHPLEVLLVDPPAEQGVLDAVVHLLDDLANQQKSRFITFVDSRKQVELISSILARARREANEKAAEEEGEVEEGESTRQWKHVLEGLNILPYRAGYEENDRKFIQEKLAEGTLNGVISTSALELGLDIPHLDTCVLVGVPSSATSLQQRIGRIGRHTAGRVIVVNGGDVTDRTVFADPPSFFTRPLAENALYLENRFIQYIHVLCLARQGGEHDQALQALRKTSKEFASAVAWPANFIDLCRKERSGQAPRDLLAMKNEAKERPNYTFPLREVESQFKVERVQGPTTSSLGSLSHAQLMREAYPGAIYYYATLPYRVTRVTVKSHQVQVRREKRYTTRPNRLPDRVFPQLTAAGIHQARQHNKLAVMEGNLLVRESINGVIENRGGSEVTYLYPLPRELGFFQDQPFFNRNYFTTGVMMTHPDLAADGIATEPLAEAVFEAFLLNVPFERGDIGWAADVFRQARQPVFTENQPFLVIFDQTYGSLRLSARLLEPEVLARVLVKAARLVEDRPGASVLLDMAREAWLTAGQRLTLGREEPTPEGLERVIMPGSKGLLLRSHEELQVGRVLQTPSGLCYEGIPSSMSGSGATIMPQVLDVAEIPGESQMGMYSPESGEVKPLAVDVEEWAKIEDIPPFGNEELFTAGMNDDRS